VAFGVKGLIKLFNVVASTLPSFTVTIPRRFMTSWDTDLGDSGVGLELMGVSPINSTYIKDRGINIHVATCELRGEKNIS